MRQAREGAQAEYYRQFNFKPAINPRSRQLAQVRCAVAAHKTPASPSLEKVTDLSRCWVADQQPSGACSISACRVRTTQLTGTVGLPRHFWQRFCSCTLLDPLRKSEHERNTFTSNILTRVHVQLLQSHDLEELVNNPKREATRAAAECAAEEAFRQSHTFRPDTSASRAVERGCDGAIVPFAGAATADRLAASKANRRARLLVSGKLFIIVLRYQGEPAGGAAGKYVYLSFLFQKLQRRRHRVPCGAAAADRLAESERPV